MVRAGRGRDYFCRKGDGSVGFIWGVSREGGRAVRAPPYYRHDDWTAEGSGGEGRGQMVVSVPTELLPGT